MQLQLNINDYKANIFLELLEIFKKDNLVENYKIIDSKKEDILEGVKESVKEVKLYKEGKLKLKSLDEVLEELW